MKKYAVIDIGSNSVRLLLVADGKVLYKRLKTTRLGENLAVSGTLLPKAISRSATAVAEFYHLAKKEGAEDVLAFATASVRFAKNGGDFLLAVKELCPLQVEVISGETEAEIGVLGALGNSDGAVLDIGVRIVFHQFIIEIGIGVERCDSCFSFGLSHTGFCSGNCGNQRQDHAQNQCQCQNFFHGFHLNLLSSKESFDVFG